LRCNGNLQVAENSREENEPRLQSCQSHDASKHLHVAQFILFAFAPRLQADFSSAPFLQLLRGILHAAKAHSSRPVVARSHEQQLAMLVVPVSLREIPD
jgi:hypothetical protein